MFSRFYRNFALKNIKTNKQLTLPYFISSTLVISLFYLMVSLTFNPEITKLRGGAATQQTLQFGIVIVAIFTSILMFYTYSFVTKKRTKEFGLYSVLGMTKRQISRLLSVETVFTAISTVFLGLLLGVILDKLAYLSLIKLIDGEVKLGFQLNIVAVLVTIGYFFFIYMLIYLTTMFRVARLNIISLLKESNTGEKEPKARWILVILGIVLIGYGYYTALTIKTPIGALSNFFYAVLAVIIGTYLLFIAVTIFVLKILKNNKNFYYKTKNFVSVSSMLFRMKRNAVGLANICILATMILVTLGTTSSLYYGKEDLVKSVYPREIVYNFRSSVPSGNEQIAGDVLESDKELFKSILNEKISKENIQQKDILEFEYLPITGLKEENGIKFTKDTSLVKLSKAATAIVMTLEDYNKHYNKNESLESNEILFKDYRNTLKPNTFNINDSKFNVKKIVNDIPELANSAANVTDSYYVVVKNKEAVDEIRKEIVKVFGPEKEAYGNMEYMYAFNINIADNKKITEAQITSISNLVNSVVDEFHEKQEISKSFAYVDNKFDGAKEINNVFGTFFFIGIIISLVFIVTQVVIMYYKQISEGYEDKGRFGIMQKVGLEDRDINNSIRSQILMIFFAPLIVSAIHVTVAYPFIEKILKLFQLSNTSVFMIAMLATFIIFSIFYAAVYYLTSKVYYKIIKD